MAKQFLRLFTYYAASVNIFFSVLKIWREMLFCGAFSRKFTISFFMSKSQYRLCKFLKWDRKVFKMYWHIDLHSYFICEKYHKIKCRKLLLHRFLEFLNNLCKQTLFICVHHLFWLVLLFEILPHRYILIHNRQLFHIF